MEPKWRMNDKHTFSLSLHIQTDTYSKPTVHTYAHTQRWEVNNHLASVFLCCVIYTLRQRAETLA